MALSAAQGVMMQQQGTGLQAKLPALLLWLPHSSCHGTAYSGKMWFKQTKT